MVKFSEFITEAVKNKAKQRYTIFDILINDEKVFSNENADIVSNKLKTKKFKQELDNIKILRTSTYGMEDVTSLFIKNGQLNEGNDVKSTELVSLNVSNDVKLYNVAMKTYNSADLKKAMIKMKTKFADASKIKFDKVDWESVYTSLNEKSIIRDF